MSRFWFNYTVGATYVGLIMAAGATAFEAYWWAVVFWLLALADGAVAVYVSLKDLVQD